MQEDQQQTNLLIQQLDQQSHGLSHDDPKLIKIHYLRGVLRLKQLEMVDPFIDITNEITQLQDSLQYALLHCQDDQLMVQLYSLLGDAYSLMDQFNAASKCYQEAMLYTQQHNHHYQLLIAIFRIHLIQQQFTDAQITLNEISNIAESLDQLDNYQELQNELNESLSDAQSDKLLSQTLQLSQQLQPKQQVLQQIPINLGIFGNAKRIQPQCTSDVEQFTKSLKLE